LGNETIAIIGGGPAGALAAEALVRGGRKVVLFDEKLAWEKPCGGGITHKALAQWPFLREAQAQRNWVRRCELIAPSGRKVSFPLRQPIAIFSRRVLNGLLLDRARQAGAEIVQDRVLQIEGRAGAWRLRCNKGDRQAGYLVLAAGARNAFRTQFAQPFSPEDLMITAGYYIPGRSQLMQIQFLAGLHGYIWLFPRSDHFSAGICSKLAGQSTSQLRATLEKTLTAFGLEFEAAGFYAHVLPSLRASTLRKSPLCGQGWALIGDAAGFVDPITGEGLYYAMRSAELLAEALLAEQPQEYEASVREDFLPELETAAGVADRFYGGNWMGQAVLERMVQFTAGSASFRALMSDIFAGKQGYTGLRRRLYRTLPAMLAEGLANAFRLPSSRAGIQTDSPPGETQAAQ
jgi:geranylgeranyl diphosphate/geranylgeranyl-bacteriochlorophyllide a reductase